MILIRRFGSVALIAAAIVIWFGMSPAPAEVDHSSDVSAIESEDEMNNARTEGAPQQTVVNGWTEHNYLALISEQLDEAATAAAEQRDDRPAAMLALCVAGIALLAFTSSGVATDQQRSTSKPYPSPGQGLSAQDARLPQPQTEHTQAPPAELLVKSAGTPSP
jgi:hypothetical protein